MTDTETAVYFPQNYGMGFGRMQDGTNRAALIVYDREGRELLRMPYDDAALVLLDAAAAMNEAPPRV